ncbi:MAG: signal peptidase I [Phenylobacterium zucineum]|nr:MAG: signal peptidase I [Phenylobacterium zucineum]
MTDLDSSAPPATGLAEILDVLKTVVVALLIAGVLRTALFQPNTIPSDSMEPTLQTGDYLLISKWDYGWSRHSLPFAPPLFEGRILEQAPRRGDVVVFKLPRDPSVLYVKRILGLPGDRIRVAGGVLFINGRAVQRADLGPVRDPGAPDLTVGRVRETLPDGRSFITFERGPGHEGDDTGTYVVPDGHYFGLGDNRDNSLDSRWPEAVGVGFIPAENLVGRVRLTLLSWRKGASVLKPWTWLDVAPERFFRPVR